MEQELHEAQVLRYTKDAWKILYPNQVDEWEGVTFPKNIMAVFQQCMIQLHKDNPNMLKNLGKIKIMTIDHEYIDWLVMNNKKDSDKSLEEYLDLSTPDDWNRRYLNSGMTTAMHMIGFTFKTLLVNVKDKKTHYILTDSQKEALKQFIRDKYKADNIFIPGWVIKGGNAIKYTNTLDIISSEYFDANRKVTLAKCEEQEYTDLELSNGYIPLTLYVPFVYKIQTTSYQLNVKRHFASEKEMYEYSPNFIGFEQKDIDMISNILSGTIPGITSILPYCSVPLHAQELYGSDLAKKVNNNTVKRY